MSSISLSSTSTRPPTVSVLDGSQLLGATIAVSLLLLTIVICVTVVIVILMWRRKGKAHLDQANSTGEDQTLSNPLYKGQSVLHRLKWNLQTKDTWKLTTGLGGYKFMNIIMSSIVSFILRIPLFP